MTEILLQHRTVKRADHRDIEGGCLLQDCLHLRAVLADDAEIVAPCLAVPLSVSRSVERAELTESVRGEQHLVGAVVCHDDLRPVNHRSRNEIKGMLTQLEGILFSRDYLPVGVVRAEKLLHHHERLL